MCDITVVGHATASKLVFDMVLAMDDNDERNNVNNSQYEFTRRCVNERETMCQKKTLLYTRAFFYIHHFVLIQEQLQLTKLN